MQFCSKKDMEMLASSEKVPTFALAFENKTPSLRKQSKFG